METVKTKQQAKAIKRKPFLLKIFGRKFFGKDVTYSPCNHALHYKMEITDFYVFGVSVYHNEESVPC